jgi:hypothetical protein
MSRKWRPTRRDFLTLGAALPAVFAGICARATEQPKDQGIGGTGWTAGTDSDQGIGGTGIVGTIQRFGSIFVNGVRVAYQPDVPVWIDGVRAASSSLKVGHVVRVAVVQQAGRVVTPAIHVTSEVVGPVERVTAGSIQVVGQHVDIGTIPKDLKIGMGDIVAVHGIRRPDGTIVASLVEARPHETQYRVRGLAIVKSGALLVGRLKIGPKTSALANRRVQLTLAKATGGYRVVHLEAEAPVPQAYVASVLYETFLQRWEHRLKSGLGVVIDDHSDDSKSTVNVRAFLDVRFDRDGNIVSASRQGNAGNQSPNQPGRPPGGPNGPGGQPEGGPGGPDGGPGGPGGPSGP